MEQVQSFSSLFLQHLAQWGASPLLGLLSTATILLLLIIIITLSRGPSGLDLKFAVSLDNKRIAVVQRESESCLFSNVVTGGQNVVEPPDIALHGGGENKL